MHHYFRQRGRTPSSIRHSFAAIAVVASVALATGASQTAAAGVRQAGLAQNPDIDVVISAPEKVLIGEEFTFTVTFDHTGGSSQNDTGWGPFVDLILDAGGADLDAAHPDYPNTPIPHLDCDGVSFVGAQAAPSTGPTTVLGPSPASFCGPNAPPAAAQVHPYGFPPVSPGLPGFQLVTAEFPVGAYTASEPGLTMIVTARVHGYADRKVPLQIRARGGYKYGVGPAPAATPPGTGANPVVQPGWESASVTPDVVCVTKTYLGPQDEAVSGPNFVNYYPLRYRIEVDIAAGQTIQGLELRDQLPKGLVYADNATTVPGGATVTPVSSPMPAALVIAKWPSVTGAVGGPDAVLEFDFYIPAKNAPPEETEGPSNPGPVVDLSTCDFAKLIDDSWALGKWWPPDPRDQVDMSGNPSDEPVDIFVNQTPEDHVLWGKCLAVQKSVELSQNTRPGADGVTPLDILEYSIPFQVSDYGTFANIVITDTLGNGQELLTNEPITLLVTDRYGITEKTFTPGETVTVTEDPELDDLSCQTYPGGTEIVFDVAAALADTDNPAPAVIVRHSLGVLTGGYAWTPASTAPAHGLITFKARIKDTYDALDDDGEPGATDPIDKHDPLVNCVEIHGWRQSNAERDEELMGLLVDAHDNCASSINIIPPETSKDIVYVNGQPVLSGPGAFGVDPGDEVTFLIKHWIPSGDAQNLVVHDWLPQPVTSVAGMPGQSAPAPLLLCGPLVPMPPPAGGACYLPPGLSNSPYGPFAPEWWSQTSDQSVTFDFGTFNSPVNAPVALEVYVTVKVTNQPFPDGMHLDNLANVCETDSWGKLYCQTVIRELVLRQPNLRIRKGVVSVSGNPAVTYDPPDTGAEPPGSKPIFPPGVVFAPAGSAGCAAFTGIVSSGGLASQPGVLNANAYGVDAGDLVRFAVVVENTGGSTQGAFDVRLHDLLPPQLTNPANLCVTDGLGDPMTFTVAGTGFFGSGAGDYIELDDPGPTVQDDPGGLDRYSAAGGRNIAVITFDATVAASLPVGQCYTNWAHTLRYAGQEGGPDHVSAGLGGPHSDPALICALPRPAKWIVATSEAHTTDATADTVADPRPLAIGEIVRYRLQVAIPEGHTPDLQLVDRLPLGLQLLEGNPVVNQTGIVFTSNTPMGVHADYTGATSAPPIPQALSPIPPPGIGVPPARIVVVGSAPVGQELTFDLGTIDNTDSDPDLEYATLDFNALVLNSFAPPDDSISANERGDARPNDFDVKVAGALVATSAAVHAVIVEPGLQLSKQVAHDLDGTNWQNHMVEYTLVVENKDHLDKRDSTAFEVEVTDQLGACLTEMISSPIATRSGGGNSGVVVTVAPGGKAFTVTIDRLVVGEKVSIKYRTTIKCNVCLDLANDAHVTWTGLPGTGTSPNATRSSTPGASGNWNGERTGAGPEPNDYLAAKSLSLCGTLCGTKFLDSDGDGVWDDPPEPSLAGWTISAMTGGQTAATVTTPHDGLDPNEPGAYCMTVLAGAYTVSEALSDEKKAVGWQQTAPGGGGSHQVNLSSGETVTGLDFGNRQCAQTVGGVKFHDLNGNGVRDAGEPGVGGWKIFAVHMTSPQMTLTAVTAADGSYSFPLGLTGQWWITEEPRAGWIRTYPIWPEGPQIPGSIASYPAGGYAAPIETCTGGFGVRPILTPPIAQTSLDFGNKLTSASCPAGTGPGRLVAWGDDVAHYSAIGGIPATQSPVIVAGKYTAVAAGGRHTLALKQNGEIRAWGNGAQVTEAPQGTGFVAVAAGSDPVVAVSGQTSGGHSLAIDSSNRLWAWGANGRGQLPGHLPGSPTVCGTAAQQCVEDSRGYRAIAAGREHSVAIDQYGDLYGWGANSFGQLPGGCATQATTCSQTGSFIAVAATAIATIALDEDGDLHGWGDNSSGVLPGGCAAADKACTLAGDFVAIAAGYYQVLAVDVNHALSAWGFDAENSVSDTPTTGSWLAVGAGAGVSFALASDRTILGWGHFEGDLPPITPPLGRYAEIAAGGGEVPDHDYVAHAVAIQCEELITHTGGTAHLPALLDKAPIAGRIIPDRRE